MKKNFLILSVLFSLLFSFGFKPALALRDVAQAGITPESSFYFLDSFFEYISLLFSNQEKKAEKLLNYSLEKAQENLLLQNKNQELSERAKHKSENYLNRLFDVLEKLRQNEKNTSKIDERLKADSPERRLFSEAKIEAPLSEKDYEDSKCVPACKNDESCQKFYYNNPAWPDRSRFPTKAGYTCRKIACPANYFRGDDESACPKCGPTERCEPLGFPETYIEGKGSCRKCESVCEPGSYARYNDCAASCGGKCESEGYQTTHFPEPCWVCPKKQSQPTSPPLSPLTPSTSGASPNPQTSPQKSSEQPSKLAPASGFWEFLDTNQNWQRVPKLPYGHLVHLIVASNGTPDIRTLLPIRIVLKIDSNLAWTATISGDPELNCRDATGCSIDGPLIQNDWQNKTIELNAYDKNELLLAHYTQ